jgi:hypothetical protein
MKNRAYKTVFLFLFGFLQGISQSYPWQRPLNIAWSNNGTTFGTPAVFQDSSGVPCVIRWKGDTLICAFQWFRVPQGSPSWDRVAVKFSYNNGLSWTSPVPIVVNGLPPNYQRPFDPALTVFGQDSLRIYFSSSNGMPLMGLDSTVNTYSARSADGINYTFEPAQRVDQAFNPVIDPSVIHFNNGWHYLAPVGSPQQGAYHYVSPNGINFSQVPVIPSDNLHNWTGNFMINTGNELRFYGGGPGSIWYNSSPNGGMWNGYVPTNIQGGDPSVLKVANGNYLMIYVGAQYAVGLQEQVQDKPVLYPNPAAETISIIQEQVYEAYTYEIHSVEGRLITAGTIRTHQINVETLSPGMYFLVLLPYEGARKASVLKFSKE